MAATARKPARGPRRPPALPPADDDEVIDLGDPAGAGDTPEPERVPVFRIGDQVYTMLKDPPASIGLRGMNLAYDHGGGMDGMAMAYVYAMREMLGEGPYRALLDHPQITREAYAKILAKVVRRVYGRLETAPDGSPNF